MWNEIISKEDIDNFMCSFGHFHDSCIKEIRYASGAYVDDNLSMHPINNKRIVDIIFQRQCKNPAVIVMRFIGANVLHLVPLNESYTCEIHEATMFIENGLIYWIDSNILAEETSAYSGTWICSEKIQWRVMDEYIGSNDVFQARLN